jgi:hypothetical protein
MPVEKAQADALHKQAEEELAVRMEELHRRMDQFKEGNDWSFVIKTHALLEATITELLVDSIGDARCKKLFSNCLCRA